MTPLRTALIEQLRARVTSPEVKACLATWSDEELVRRMLVNYRDENGLRLTQFGHQIMQTCFQCFEFDTAKQLQAAHVLFLSKRCTLPYYHAGGKLCVYDGRFASLLRLAGDLDTMIEVDTVD
jgi:hypothetical protein